MTEHQFRASDDKRTVLLTFLQNPVIQEAFSLVAKVPTEPPEVRAGIHIDTLMAHEFCRIVGANTVFKKLDRLTQPLAQRKDDPGDEEEWMHAIPDNLKETPKQP
jgi:hypothetical protein